MSRPPGEGAERPAQAIDRSHLSRQTLGDTALQRELLAIFDRRSEDLVGRLAGAQPEARRDLAHGLKGSALAIGATRVAAAAAHYEGLIGRAADEATLAAAYRELADAVSEARAEIGAIRAEA
ncbi:MAG: Hpt domain-containing protein [Methylobacteriaceae bacterium]|nr:Hpt domain-containing protein [Methylobacteriaceae bacterium]MBV9703351.1 Hpt domain-containing protein [Methylobacteriaceae bacterium]